MGRWKGVSPSVVVSVKVGVIGCGVEEGHQLHPLLCLLKVGVVGWGGGGDGGRTRGHFAVSRV